MSVDILARLHGLGRIRREDGTSVLARPCEYVIEIYRTRIDVGRGETIPSPLRRMTGTLGVDTWDGNQLVVSDDLVLVLEDGEELPIAVSSASGDFKVRGLAPEWFRRIGKDAGAES